MISKIVYLFSTLLLFVTVLSTEEIPCEELSCTNINCAMNYSCIYGEQMIVNCTPLVPCKGEKSFNKTMICRYCYLTNEWEHKCLHKSDCQVTSTPTDYYTTNCTVHDNVLCLGRRDFKKRIKCNWTRGHQWSTAVILSVTLGGFGADRFYLGHWQEGIGKLFSFGGLGVWTILDVILTAIGYLGPSDGSLYV